MFIKVRILHLVPSHTVDDSDMMVFHIVARCFALVDAGTVGQKVFRDGFLHLNVAHILLIPQDDHNGACSPFLSVDRELFHLVQFPCDFICRLSFDKAVENVPDDFCLLRHDDPLLIGSQLIPQHSLQIDVRNASLKLLLDASADVVRYGTTIILCKSRKDGLNQFAFVIQRVDILFFKVDTHGRLQLSKLTGTS